MTLRYDWTSRAAFETIDTLRDYCLNHRNIQSFLRLQGHYATDSEVIAIIRRLDIDADQKVTYDEFADGFRAPVPTPSVLNASTRFEEEKRLSSPLRQSQASPSRRFDDSLGASQLGVSSSSFGASRFQSPGKSLTSSSYGAAAKRQSPMKLDDEEELVRAFKEQIRLEQELEDSKSRLALQSDFNLPDAFDILDIGSKGWTTAYEIKDQLATLGLYPLMEDIYLFVKRYDKNNDGRLRYHEFTEAFLPKSASHSTTLKLRQSYYIGLRYLKHEYFTRDTRDLFLRTFKTHFSVENSAEFVRRRLFRRPGFSASDAFSACD